MKKNNLLLGLIPVLFGFFVMGFVDVVGIATNYVKADFKLPDSVSGFLPSMVFIWFLLLSVPTAIMMNRIGRKNTVLLSMVVTLVGMLVPFIGMSFGGGEFIIAGNEATIGELLGNTQFLVLVVGFILLGVGNTILQVSLNPLLSNVVKGEALTSALTAGQVVKAVCSFLGPIIAAKIAVGVFGNWQHVFTIFAVITLVSGLWLMVSPIQREVAEGSASMGQTFGLLKDKTILLLFLGIVAVVGIDVGTNISSAKLLMWRLDLNPNDIASVDRTAYAPSVYFACRTVGAFIGTALLLKMKSISYFRIHIIAALVVMALLLFIPGEIATVVLVGLVGFTISSIFSVIFGMAMQARPEKANEISGLMITGVFGGAVIPPLMSWVGTLFQTPASPNNQTGAIIVLALAVCYLIYCSFGIKVARKA